MHKRKSIGCEGITDDCKLLILYEAEEERKKQQRIFCAQRFEKCEIYEMIMKAKYTEEYGRRNTGRHGRRRDDEGE